VSGVFEDEDDFAGEPGVHLVNPVGVHEGGAVDAEKFRRVEASFEFYDGLVYTVTASVDDGECELVLSDEM